MTGFEPLIPFATNALASLATELINEEGGKFFGILSTNLKQQTQQRIYQASGEYIGNFKERHGIVKVLGMRQPVGLDSIYTSVQLLDSWDFRSSNSVEELEFDFRVHQQTNSYLNYENLYSGIDIANSEQFLTVLGGPGSGKTTFLKWIGLEALKSKEGEFQHQCIPVFIELKRFTENDINSERLVDYISNEFSICGFPSNPRKFTLSALNKGRLLVLLDGLDEVPTTVRNSVIGVIQDLADRYDKNRFVVSCRVAAYLHNFRRFTDVKIADFTDAQIRSFMTRWFSQKEEDKTNKTAEKCWKILIKPENSNAKEFAHTPLLLTFLCLVYDRSQRFSRNRSSLYRKALRILLEEWAASKRIYQEEIYEGLDTDLEEVLLSEIAYENFSKNIFFFSREDLISSIKKFISTNLNIPGNLSGESILASIEIQQGILVERVDSLYSFSHLTLQEYLSAKYVNDHDYINDIVDRYLFDPKWREVFLLVSGLMVSDGADQLLFKICQSIQSIKQHEKLKLLSHWLKCLSFQSDFDRSVETIVRNQLIILFICLDKTVSRARYVDLSILHCSKLVEEISRLLNYKQSFENRKNLSQFLQKINQIGIYIKDQQIQEAFELSQDIRSEYYRIQKISDNRIYSFLNGLVKTLAKLCEGNLEEDLAKLKARDLILNVIGKLSISEPQIIYLAKNIAKNLIDLLDLVRTHSETIVLPPQESKKRDDRLSILFEKNLSNFQKVLNFNVFKFDKFSHFLSCLEELKGKLPKTSEGQVQREFFCQELELLVNEFLCCDSINASELLYGMDDSFTDYLYALDILIACKKEALRVSPVAWKAILESIIS